MAGHGQAIVQVMFRFSLFFELIFGTTYKETEKTSGGKPTWGKTKTHIG